MRCVNGHHNHHNQIKLTELEEQINLPCWGLAVSSKPVSPLSMLSTKTGRRSYRQPANKETYYSFTLSLSLSLVFYISVMFSLSYNLSPSSCFSFSYWMNVPPPHTHTHFKRACQTDERWQRPCQLFVSCDNICNGFSCFVSHVAPKKLWCSYNGRFQNSQTDISAVFFL